jgi:hypothetical protein
VAKQFEFQVNVGPITAAVEKAFSQANELFNRNAAKEITDDKWYWPSQPSPRDVIDLGGLKGSYQPLQVSPTEYEHSWTVDYAMAVHEGALFGGSDGSNPTAGYPSRPWTKAPLERFPKDFEKLAKANLGGVK